MRCAMRRAMMPALFKLFKLAPLLCAACAGPDVVINCQIPQGYLQLPPRPAVPAETVSNLQLAQFIYALDDEAKLCRSQIKAISRWRDERTNNRDKIIGGQP